MEKIECKECGINHMIKENTKLANRVCTNCNAFGTLKRGVK